jgi:hypothetical protein
MAEPGAPGAPGARDRPPDLLPGGRACILGGRGTPAHEPTHPPHTEPAALMDTRALLEDLLDRTVERGTRALDSREVLELEAFEQKLRTLDSICRESFQETLRDAYQHIADKLDRGEAIDANERNALELLFTGEAKYYLKTENNFDDWIDELKRLVGELRATRSAGMQSLADLMHVQALCRDAIHVMPEVLYYHREKERVELFRENLHGEISREQGRMLARLIRDLMSSPNR